MRGNERADHLAGTGPIECALQMGESEVLIALKYSVDKEESESPERAVENGVKRGSARTKEWIGKEKLRMNQLISGTISLGTLRWLLGWRAEQVWVCPDCNDADF